MKKIPGVQEDILPAVRRFLRRWQWASGDLRTLREEERRVNSRREHESRERRHEEGQEERGEREESRCVPAWRSFRRPSRICYPPRGTRIRAHNTIRGVIPPSPLPDTSSTSTSTSPSSPLSWTLFLVPRFPLSFWSATPPSGVHSFLKLTRSIYYRLYKALFKIQKKSWKIFPSFCTFISAFFHSLLL